MYSEEEEFQEDTFLNTSNVSIASFGAEVTIGTPVDLLVPLDTELESLESMYHLNNDDLNFPNDASVPNANGSTCTSPTASFADQCGSSTSPQGAEAVRESAQVVKSGEEVAVSSQQTPDQEAASWIGTAKLELTSSKFSSLGYRCRFLSESLFADNNE